MSRVHFRRPLKTCLRCEVRYARYIIVADKVIRHMSRVSTGELQCNCVEGAGGINMIFHSRSLILISKGGRVTRMVASTGVGPIGEDLREKSD